MKWPTPRSAAGSAVCSASNIPTSNVIVERATGNVAASGAGTLLAGDMGCLMNMVGKLQRQGSSIEIRHVAEVLAGMTDAPSIGRSR